MEKFLLVISSLLIIAISYFYFHVIQFSKWLESGRTRIEEFKGINQVVNRDILPPLLQQYLKMTILRDLEGNYVSFSQEGDFRMRADDKMSPFTAEQIVNVQTPMFSWVAQISMKRLKVTVCDRLIDNQGELEARIFGAITLAKGSGDRFLRGELLRYLAELPWYPHAILKQPLIQWTQISENKIKGTIVVNSVIAAVEYTFSPDGLIESIYVPDREKADGNSLVETPWLGEFSHYKLKDGLLIPMIGQVSWMLPDGKFTYFIGHIKNYKISKLK